MPINIKDPETDARIRELVALTGESITDAVRIAIELRLRQESLNRREGVARQLLDIGMRLSNRPRLFAGTAEEAIDYDSHGLPR